MGRKTFTSKDQLIAHWERRATYLRRSNTQDAGAPQVRKCIEELKELHEPRDVIPTSCRGCKVSHQCSGDRGSDNCIADLWRGDAFHKG